MSAHAVPSEPIVRRSLRDARGGILNARLAPLSASGQAISAPPGVPRDDVSDRDSPPTVILVVESDGVLGGRIVEQLAADGYQSELAHTAEHARTLAMRYPPKLVIIGDLDSPRGALEMLGEIRHADRERCSWVRGLPVIVVSSRAQELDMLRAFEAGADDFLARPACYLELRARLQAVLRRSESVVRRERLLGVGPLVIDVDAHAVSLHGQRLDLRRLEYELLLQLATDPDRVFSKQELLCSVWGYRSSPATRTVDSHACRLRRKLVAADAHPRERWVINVWGVGYYLYRG
jgi:DNA-binding response OmpR family regulator